jgi:voltage-gated potassium channel
MECIQSLRLCALAVKSYNHSVFISRFTFHVSRSTVPAQNEFMTNKHSTQFSLTVVNLILLAFLLFSIFFVMLFPERYQKSLYQISMTGILLSAFYCIENRYRRIIRWFILLDIILIWAYFATTNFILNGFSKSLLICLYFIIVIILVKQAASSRTVTSIVILESVNGYLMIGLFYSIIIALIMLFNPEAYTFHANLIKKTDAIVTNFNEYIYYGFNAFTTVTYGDVMPLSPLAKSVSMAIGFTGQMYVALIIAMLIGKYAGSREVKNTEADIS